MLKHFLLAIILLFWISMNVLLWRSEFGGRGQMGSAVPVELVWEKILTAPDDSAMEINYQGQKIGYCRWIANVGENLGTGRMMTEELEGMIKQPAFYTVDLEGSVNWPEGPLKFRVDFHAEFNTNKVWQSFQLRIGMRPNMAQISAVAATETVTFKMEGDAPWERKFRFDELKNPTALLQEMGVPFLPSLLAGFLPGTTGGSGSPLSLGLEWESRNDLLRFGHSHIRIYRVQARLFDEYKIVILLSRVGEILRVELPNQLLLLNDALVNF